MTFKRILLAALACALTSACGGNNNSDAASNEDDSGSSGGTSSPSEEALPWSSVSYKWTSHWDGCRSNSLTVNRSGKISSDRCGKVQSQSLSSADFDLIQNQVAPVMQSFSATLECDDEAMMDYAVYTYLTVGDETKKMYQFDDKQKCSRGDRTAAEQLQVTLEVLHDKYVPDTSSEPTED